MVGFGYIEVSVHHMDIGLAPRSLSHLGLTVWVKGVMFSCFASQRIRDHFAKQSMSRAPRCGARLDWVSIPPGTERGHGGQTVESLIVHQWR